MSRIPGLVLLIAALLVAAAARGDTVYLKNGQKIEGKVTRADGKVIVEAPFGTIPIPEADVLTIVESGVSGVGELPVAGEGLSTLATPLPAQRPFNLLAARRPESVCFSLMRNLAASSSGFLLAVLLGRLT